MPLLLILSLTLAADEPAPKPIEPAKFERSDAVDYAKEIAPIFEKKCETCHSGRTAKSTFYVDSYETVMKGGKRGPAVVPAKPNDSRLFQFAAHQKNPIMPPKDEGDDLTPQELALLKLWIEQGAKASKGVEARPRRTVVLTLPPALVKPVRALAMHGNTLAVARGNQVHLLDAKTGEVTATLVDSDLKTADGKPANAAHISIVESLAFSPDGAVLATGSFREVTLWHVEKKAVTDRLAGFADKVTAIAWSGDGKHFATAGGAPTEDGEITLWTALRRKVLAFKSPHSDTVFGLAFSHDSKFLASAGADKFVRIFEVPGGKLVKSFEGHTQHALDVGWSPDGKRIVSAGADDLIKIWNVETGERTRDLRGAQKQVTRLAFIGKSPNFLTVGGDLLVRRWNIETGDPGRTFGEAKDFLYAVAANVDGTIIATGGEEGLVRIYDGKSGQLQKSIAPGARK